LRGLTGTTSTAAFDDRHPPSIHHFHPPWVSVSS
jgi:hypothetical protein